MPVHGVSFMAYGTRKWGVNVAAGDIEGDQFDEILTAPGPGAVFGPHIRGWDHDGYGIRPVPGLSFFAYGTRKFGAVATCCHMDDDDWKDVVTAPGPSPLFSAHIRGWRFDGVSVTANPDCNFLCWPPTFARYGARVYGDADLNWDGKDELVVGVGPDPDVGGYVRIWDFIGGGSVSFLAYPDTWKYGANVAAGRFLELPD
jgi:hypothetical protein